MSAKVRLGLLACGPCRRPPQIPLRLLRRDTSQCIDHHEPYNILEQQHSGISRKFKSDDSRTFKCLNLYSTCIVRKCVRVCVCVIVSTTKRCHFWGNALACFGRKASSTSQSHHTSSQFTSTISLGSGQQGPLPQTPRSITHNTLSYSALSYLECSKLWGFDGNKYIYIHIYYQTNMNWIHIIQQVSAQSTIV